MILCIGTTPAAQRVMIFRKLTLDAVNRATTTVDGAAGKSVNVAKVLKELEADPLLVSILGGDSGRRIDAILKGKKIATELVWVSAATRQCITVIDESSGRVTELVEESPPVVSVNAEQLIPILLKKLAVCRAVVMSGTLAPGLPRDLYRRCTEMARESGALSIVDAQGAPLIEALKARPGLVKPNRAELAATTGRQLEDERAVIAAMRELSNQGAERVVVTAGKEPALASDGRTWWRIHSPRIRALNPIGSGDAFTAGLVWRLERGDNLDEACKWGAAAGAANALTIMAGEVVRKQVERLVTEVRVERI